MPKDEQQKIRLEEAGIFLSDEELAAYICADDILSKEALEKDTLPLGYKKCGKCKEFKKFYLFNRNLSSKVNCTGNCKECQKITAKKSYGKNKHKRDYKAYYRENKEMKREQGRKYYQKNREKILANHQKYRQTQQGKAAMNRARKQRKQTMKANAGIPYTRELVIQRDKLDNEFPICCLCNELITDIDDIHMEHLIPISSGGADCFTNVGCAHSTCNLTKTKDAVELTTEQVQTIRKRAEDFIDKHPEDFPGFNE